MDTTQQNMETKLTFRNLVTNKYMFDFDYNHRFSFQTVFYKSTYSYCCCSCGFDHEYLDYISESGEINEETYGKIVQSIINGKCPHVDSVSVERLNQTYIDGIHIAAAVGTEEAITDHLENYHPTEGGLFQLTPFDIAVFKGNLYVVSLYHSHRSFKIIMNESNYKTNKLLYAKRSTDSTSKVRMYAATPVEICVQKRYNEILKLILCGNMTRSHLGVLFRYTLKHHFTDTQEILLRYTEQLVNNISVLSDRLLNYHRLAPMIESAVMYNKPDTLKRILTFTSPSTLTAYPRRTACIRLNRQECKIALARHGFCEEEGLSAKKQAFRMLDLLTRFDDFKEEINIALQGIPGMKVNWISEYLFDSINDLTPQLVKVFLDSGADANYTDSDDTAVLTNVLDSDYLYVDDVTAFREIVNVLIDENLNLDLHTAAVATGIEIDERMLPFDNHKLLKTGFYITDVRLHGIFGYDHNHNFALNFMGPFLMECGFPVTRSVLLHSLEKSLHQDELAYIQHRLNNPASLMVFCRNVLRKKFTGRKIHAFLDTSDCPKTTKDFVLMKPQQLCRRYWDEDADELLRYQNSKSIY